MRQFVKLSLVILMALIVVIGVAACGNSQSEAKQHDTSHKVEDVRESLPEPYVTKNHLDFNNFNKAQKLYDTPSTIIWCTTTLNNPSSPLITVPIAGKLTSSSVSYLPQDKVEEKSDNAVVRENYSNDGMYHGHPPAYRYGFTPGGQYFDFSEMPAICTTALTEFQRQSTEVTIAVNKEAEVASEKAEAALAEGTDPSTGKVSPEAEAEAQRVLLEANLDESK